MQIVECVPNFSEGRNKETIEKIVDSIKSVPKIEVLHQTSDPDHNRTVITFIGPVKNVTEAAFRATETAAQLINLNEQKGVHPRLGSTDVIPLVPLQNITFEELNIFASSLAQRITNDLSIPTHLYEKAAKKVSKENLANIRLNHPKPDFKPTKPHKTAGETCVGVREILIAFNVNIESTNINIAKQIASKIRRPYLKALGLKLESKNIVQVSMNLTNYKEVSPQTAFNLIAEEAKKLNVDILESELIGLIPEDALPDNPEKSLKLKITEDQILKI